MLLIFINVNNDSLSNLNDLGVIFIVFYTIIVQMKLTQLLSASILNVSLWMSYEIQELLVFGQNAKKQISQSPNLRLVPGTNEQIVYVTPIALVLTFLCLGSQRKSHFILLFF